MVRVFIPASGGPEKRKHALEDFEFHHRLAVTEARRDLNMIREVGPDQDRRRGDADQILLAAALGGADLHDLIVIHRWDWTITRHPDGTTTATAPDGRILHSHRPPRQTA